MPIATWTAGTGGLYWIDVFLGDRELSVMVDLGLVDPKGRVGFSVDAPLYDTLKRAGVFSQFLMHSRLDASGHIALTESGETAAQLIDPAPRQRVGPALRMHVFRGSPNVPNRVGVAFFHELSGCVVRWTLDQKLWQIEYP